MRPYFEVARRSFQRHLAYRGATLAGLFTNAVFGVLLSAVFAAFYDRDRAADPVAGFTLGEALAFVWVGQSLIMVVAFWGTWDIAASIQSGDVVADLLKPVDYYAYWLSRDLGRAACHVLTRCAPTLLFGVLLYRLPLPGDPITWLAFGLSVALAVLVSFAFRFVLNLTAFWLTDIQGVRSLQLGLVNFLSGFLLPLAFFPPWLRAVAEALPFRTTAMSPIEVFLGHGDLAGTLARQALWAMAMTGLALASLRVAVRKLAVQGG